MKKIVWIYSTLILTAVTMMGDAQASDSFSKKYSGKFKRFNVACERVLHERVPRIFHKPLRVAGHAIPLIPIFKTLEVEDSFFYLIVEQPTMAVVQTPIGKIFSNALAGKPLTDNLASDALEVFISRNPTELARNAVNVTPESKLSKRKKYWYNWYLSTLIYGSVTGLPKLLAANSLDATIYASSLIVDAGLWPFFSQWMSTNVLTPLFFSKYPKATLLNQLRPQPIDETKPIGKGNDGKVHLDELLVKREQKVQALRDAIETGNGWMAEYKDAKGYKKVLRSIRGLVSKAREDLTFVEAEIKWINWFRKDLGESDDVPQLRRAEYWVRKSSVSVVVSICMIALYFTQRNVLVGKKEGDDGLIAKVFRAMMTEHDPNAKVTDEDVQNATTAVNAIVKKFHDNPASLPATPDAGVFSESSHATP